MPIPSVQLQSRPAVEELRWSEIRERLYRHARRSCSSLQDSDVDDIVQLALLRYFRLVEGGGTVEHLVAWLRKALTYELADHFRKSATTVPLSGPDSQITLACDFRDSPEHQAIRRDLQRAAIQWIEHLPAPFRQIARLQIIHGRSRREVAQWLMLWRPIGEEEARRLMKRTHSCLRRLSSVGVRDRPTKEIDGKKRLSCPFSG